MSLPTMFLSLSKSTSSTLKAKILYILEVGGPMTSRELAERLGINPKVAQRELQILRKMGYVECYKRPRRDLSAFLDAGREGRDQRADS